MAVLQALQTMFRQFKVNMSWIKYNISCPQIKVFLNNVQTANLFNCTEPDKTTIIRH